MTETRDSNNPLPLSVLEQLERIERQRKRGELDNAIVHGLLAAAFAVAAGVIAVSMVFAAPY
jgi:hypothetical protein